MFEKHIKQINKIIDVLYKDLERIISLPIDSNPRLINHNYSPLEKDLILISERLLKLENGIKKEDKSW